MTQPLPLSFPQDEKSRIERAGGRVVFDGYANYRVYAKNARYPGTEMSSTAGGGWLGVEVGGPFKWVCFFWESDPSNRTLHPTTGRREDQNDRFVVSLDQWYTTEQRGSSMSRRCFKFTTASMFADHVIYCFGLALFGTLQVSKQGSCVTQSGGSGLWRCLLGLHLGTFFVL